MQPDGQTEMQVHNRDYLDATSTRLFEQNILRLQKENMGRFKVAHQIIAIKSDHQFIVHHRPAIFHPNL